VLRIGSANLCNRSMGMDTECDVLVESRGDAQVAHTIRGFRDRLLAEHLGVSTENLVREIERTGSLHGAIAALSSEGRSLRRLEEIKEWPEAIISIASVADPDEPIALDILNTERMFTEPGLTERPAWGKLAIAALIIALLAAVWRFTPLAGVVTPENTIAWAKEFGSQWWAPFVVMVAYTPACFVMFPRPLITLAAVVAFGPWLGFLYALLGIVGSAVVTYYVGRRMRRDTVRRLAGAGLDRMVEVLRKYGLLAMTLLRLVPLAPFAIEGIVAGAVRLKLWHLAAGTAIGMLPGTLATTVFGDQLESALSGGSFNWWIVGGVLLLLGVGTWAVKRWFSAMAGRMDEPTGQPR
jgi:phospholipase D1/2